MRRDPRRAKAGADGSYYPMKGITDTHISTFPREDPYPCITDGTICGYFRAGTRMICKWLLVRCRFWRRSP